MLSLMNSPRRILLVVAVFFVAILFAGCGQVTPVPTATATTAPSFAPVISSITPTTIPSPTNTFTVTPEPGAPPGCKIINEDGKLYVLSDDVFFAFGPSVEELDQALVGNYPEWANYEQNVSWSSELVTVGKIVREASFQEKFALNSAVTLVTLGESLNWQLPTDSDLFLQSLTISERLVRLWDEYSHPDNEVIRSRNSKVTNGATYALYILFDYDTNRLQAWCGTYQRLFGTSP